MVERLRKAYTRYIEAYRDYLRVRQELAILERIQLLNKKSEELIERIKKMRSQIKTNSITLATTLR